MFKSEHEEKSVEISINPSPSETDKMAKMDCTQSEVHPVVLGVPQRPVLSPIFSGCLLMINLIVSPIVVLALIA